MATRALHALDPLYSSRLRLSHFRLVVSRRCRANSPADGYLGVHAQPQEGLSRVGIHVPAGRLSVTEAREIADIADKYSPNGEIRLTVEQNVILPNVPNDKVDALLAEPCLNGESRLSVKPGNIVANLVSCTGAQFCGLAMIETSNAQSRTHLSRQSGAGPPRLTLVCLCVCSLAWPFAPCAENNAEEIAKDIEARMHVPRAVRIHWTGCPNSCGQVQAGDIGLMGGPAKKVNEAGKMKAVPGVKVFVGGTIGETGKLSLDQSDIHGGAGTEGVPIEELTPVLSQLIIDRFGGSMKPEFEAEQAAWRAQRDVFIEEQEREAAEKAAKKAEKAAAAAAAAAAA